jgi:hypothetical protein
MFMGVGDDVDSKVEESRDAYRFFELMLKMGYDDNEIKQLLTRDQHEFLRVIYYNTGMYTCINRSLPGYICGDMERGGADAEERLRSGFVNIHLLRRRGLEDEVCRVLEKCSIARWGRIKTDKGKGGYVNLSKYVIHGAVEDGGLGIPDSEGCIWELEDKVPKGVLKGIRMRSTNYDLTREMVMKKIDDLSLLGMNPRFKKEDIEEFAKASHETESLNRAMHELINREDVRAYWTFKTNVVRKRRFKADYNEQLLRTFIKTVDSYEVKRANKIIGRYAALKNFVQFTDGSKRDLERSMAEHGENIIDADELTLDIRAAIICPEWVVSRATEFCKYMVFCRMLSKHEAKDLGSDLLFTYHKTFKDVMM